MRGQDTVYDPVQVSLRPLPVWSGYFGYEHAWSRVFTTAVTYGVVNVSNLDIQLEASYIAENSTVESKQFFESLDAWQRCSD